ncbi:hypothetical protein C2845_PM13G08010 [Panicum miliaceum]|uniref:Uncharacterized protein n=1 Tax=Panicum miliaceum TaxID=4540 RepID=A0A3L6RHH7_PANMI|nr:hypothetical protein C2845_PM13G08010 [Panicum miliaceum]
MVTIFRVPAHVREANKQLYEPRMVSIGPYYRGREQLRAMEQHKLRYLDDFLGRGMGETPPPLSSYVKAVREVEERARHSYYERTKLFDIKNEANVIKSSDSLQNNTEASEDAQDGFAEMLLLDGCFILEFLLKWHEIKDGADFLHNIGWGLALLNSDLLLLENQIPFFVLVSLYTVLSSGRMPEDGVDPPTPQVQLIRDLADLLQNATFSQYQHPPSGTVFTVEIHHLLHLYHETFVPKPKPRPEPCNIQPGGNPLSEQAAHTPGAPSAQVPEAAHINGGNDSSAVIPCATQLREAGVRFKQKESVNMFDITFSSGVMEIPRVEIDHANKPLLVNLIAFEQSMGNKGAAAPLTSYTALMTGLVRTGKDVEVLQKHGIIDNMLSSEDDAAKSYFNHLGACSTLDYDDHYYAPEFALLKKHYKSNWNKYKAKFRQDHCANPCSIVSLIVTVMVFSFAVSQASIAFYRLHSHH